MIKGDCKPAYQVKVPKSLIDFWVASLEKESDEDVFTSIAQWGYNLKETMESKVTLVDMITEVIGAGGPAAAEEALYYIASWLKQQHFSDAAEHLLETVNEQN